MTQVEVGPAGDVVVVHADGEFDLGNCDQLRTGLVQAADRTRRLVVLNCAGLAFIDSATIGVLVGATKRSAQAGHRLQLVLVSPTVGRVLRIVGLWHVLDCREDLGELAGRPELVRRSSDAP